MRALVTGATGFVGSHLVELLVERGETVAVMLRNGGDPWRIEHLLSSVVRIEADLGAVEGSRGPVEDFAPETVFHLAWGGVGRQQRDDHARMARNLDGSVSLFRLAARAGCRVWVGLGSQAEYGPQDRAIGEGAPTHPRSPYGVVKLCTCWLTRALADEAGVRHAWVRLFSAYGPKDHPDSLISYLIRALQRGERPALTAGAQLWDYVYITDVAEALYRIAVGEAARGIFNLGSGRARPVREVAGLVRDLIDPRAPLGLGEVPYAPDQVMHLEADISRLRAVTGWGPRVVLEEGLRRTVDWFGAVAAPPARAGVGGVRVA